MFIDTSSPELANFDPESTGLALPPVGVYHNITLQVINSAAGETTTKQGKFDITYEVLDGGLPARSQFKLTYNTGHSNPDTAKWAREDVLRIVYAITGLKTHARGVNFDSKMYYKPFTATLTVTNQDKVDDKGRPFRNGKLTAPKPLAGGTPEHSTTTATPTTNYYNETGQPITANQYNAQNKPDWAK